MPRPTKSDLWLDGRVEQGGWASTETGAGHKVTVFVHVEGRPSRKDVFNTMETAFFDITGYFPPYVRMDEKTFELNNYGEEGHERFGPKKTTTWTWKSLLGKK